MNGLDTLRAMLTRQIENRENRVSRRQRRADVREKNRGFRHPAGDYQIAREQGLLAELRTIAEEINRLAARANRAEANERRYLHLRNNCVCTGISIMEHNHGDPTLYIDFSGTGWDLDAAIDAACAEDP